MVTVRAPLQANSPPDFDSNCAMTLSTGQMQSGTPESIAVVMRNVWADSEGFVIDTPIS